MTHFNGLDLLVLVLLGVNVALCLALLRYRPRHRLVQCETRGCRREGVVLMEKPGIRMTWRCARCAEELKERGLAQ